MKNIAVYLESFCAYGRALSDGIASYARDRRDWTLHLMARESIMAPRVPCDGIIARILDSRLGRALAASGIPVVDVYGRNGLHPDIPTVMPDHALLAQRAARFFRERFYVNFAYCGFNGFTFSDLRRNAFCAELARHGFGCSVYPPSRRVASCRIQGFFRREEADLILDRADLTAWLGILPRPVAVFCCNSLRAYQLFRICQSLGRDVPSECAILAGDEDPVLCLFAEKALSSIDPAPYAVGRAAAERLDGILSGRRAAARATAVLVPPGGIVERASTAFYPTSPAWLSDVLSFIDANLYRPLQAAEVFACAPVSHTIVERIFRKRLGCSVLRYVTERKLSLAKRLLRETDLRVFEIAGRTGFASSAYFCRVFKRFFRQSPQAARNATGKSCTS